MSNRKIPAHLFSAIGTYVRAGYGWEDAYVKLLRKGLIGRHDKEAVRTVAMSYWPKPKVEDVA